MDFKRKAYDQLIQWKNKKNHKPIIVKGLRQVGKSYIVSKFAKENYEHVVVFDFRHQPILRKCFSSRYDVDQIISYSKVYLSDSVFVPYKTAIIFEEINDCEEARTSLKAFALDGRYDVLATGSLLGVNRYGREKKTAIPTEYEEYLEMSSLDFEEFLWAMNTPLDAIENIKKSLMTLREITPSYHEYFKEMIIRYIAIGGMPDAISAFINSNNNYLEARKVQERLLLDYRGDFGRHILDDGREMIDYSLQMKLNQIIDSLPSQLSHETDSLKFKFSEMHKGARQSQYIDAIAWLAKAGLILPVYNTKAIESPLEANKNDASFKLFLSDIGLLMACFPLSTLQELIDHTLGSRKGAIYENLSATMIHKAGFPLYFYGDYQKHLDIDFLLETKEGIVLLEEKSTNGKMAASRNVMENKTPYHAAKCIKIIQDGIGEGSFYTSYLQYLEPFYLQMEKDNLESCFIAKEVKIG